MSNADSEIGECSAMPVEEPLILYRTLYHRSRQS